MSKLSPLGQSMASLFSPESERARAGQAKATGTRGPVGKVHGSQSIKADKSGDSLGNGSSPGYEHFGKKKTPADHSDDDQAEGPAGTLIEPPVEGPNLIRLSVGWDKILLAQKKLCEKAKNIFTRLEGPENYRVQKKGKLLARKSRGCIVDLDLQRVEDDKAAAAKAALEKKEAESA